MSPPPQAHQPPPQPAPPHPPLPQQAPHNPQEVPAWVSLVQDQVPEPVPLEPIRDGVTTSDADREHVSKKGGELELQLRAQYAELEARIRQQQGLGLLPDENRRFESKEPLNLVRTLARSAMEILNSSAEPADVRRRMQRLIPWFQNQPMETRGQILDAIGRYAAQDRERFERFIRRNEMKGREYYRHPRLQDPILSLYRGLERISGSAASHDPSQERCVENVLESMLHPEK